MALPAAASTVPAGARREAGKVPGGCARCGSSAAAGAAPAAGEAKEGSVVRQGLVVGIIVLVLAGIAGFFWWQQRHVADIAAPVATAPVPDVAPAPLPAPAASSAASQPAIRHPIEPSAAAASAPMDLTATLVDLFGRKAVLSTFQLDDFPRRVVATVDNLARPSASARLWPVNPAGGRLKVEQRADGEVIGADNGERYTPFVLLVESADTARAVAAYRRLYPSFQQAYEELGYPGRYFNDRLVEVIDHLLATPETEAPLKVHLPEIKGPLQPQRPWVLYEFDDPALESLSAGQKMLLRMGPVNERRLKRKLAELRAAIASPASPASPASASR